MSKNAKILITVVLIILVVIICCIAFRKDEDKEQSKNIVDNNVTSNFIENNTINENGVANNTLENEIIDEEPVIENVTEVEPQGTVYESNSDAGTTDKKQQAISLVKEKWGEDDTVTFRCDSVSSNGEYIIAVISKETASVKNYFKVNLTTKTVEIDY